MGDIMCSKVGVNGDIVTFDIGVSKSGRPIYRISWFRNGVWSHARYSDFKAAHTTWMLVSSMI